MLEVIVVQRDKDGCVVRTIGTMTIANDGTGDELCRNYDVEASVVMPPPLRATFFFKGKVKNFDRHSGVWQLVAKAIKGLKA